MKLNLFFISVVVGYMFWGTLSAMACTGITLKSQNGTAVVARTIEWGGSNLNSQYVIVPRGYSEQSFTPDGQKELMKPDSRLVCFIFHIMENMKIMIKKWQIVVYLIFSSFLGYLESVLLLKK